MSEEKKEQKIDLKDRMLNEDDLGQVSGGTEIFLNAYCTGYLFDRSNTCFYCPSTNCPAHV